MLVKANVNETGDFLEFFIRNYSSHVSGDLLFRPNGLQATIDVSLCLPNVD